MALSLVCVSVVSPEVISFPSDRAAFFRTQTAKLFCPIAFSDAQTLSDGEQWFYTSTAAGLGSELVNTKDTVCPEG